LKTDVHIIPPHTSHLIQPLDKSVFASMKRYIRYLYFYYNIFTLLVILLELYFSIFII
jgi:hypothetical protein